MNMPGGVHISRQARGFSLVEMLVALGFTMVLVAGMATLFKGSLSTFVQTNEQMSNSRRNRMASDTLREDLNNMGMYLMSLTTYPSNLTTANPGFFVSPNVRFAASGLDAQGSLPASWSYPGSTADQLYLYFDDPIPYDGSLGTDLPGLASMEASGVALANSNTYIINFPNDGQAPLVKSGMFVVFRDVWDVKPITSVQTLSSTSIEVTTAGATSQGGYDSASGAPTGATPLSKLGHISNRNVLVINPAQQVRYSVQARALDPSDPAKKIPCLMREQGTYGGAFDPSQTVVVAENVIGFKAFVSVDQGATWAGQGYTTVGSDGAVGAWNDLTPAGKFRQMLNTSLSSLGRTGFKDTNSPNWYREIPIMVRVDILTRTMNKRAEYGNQNPAAPTADYGTRMQTLVIVPRHTGLPLG